MKTANSTRIQQIATATIALLLINVNLRCNVIAQWLSMLSRLPFPHSLSNRSVWFSLAIDRLTDKKIISKFNSLGDRIFDFILLFFFCLRVMTLQLQWITNVCGFPPIYRCEYWVQPQFFLFHFWNGLVTVALVWVFAAMMLLKFTARDSSLFYGSLFLFCFIVIYRWLLLLMILQFFDERMEKRERESNINVSYVAVDIIHALYEMHC